jgi:hypothetical protein
MFKKKHKICQTTDIVAVARMSKGRNKDCGPEDICPECIDSCSDILYYCTQVVQI